MAGMARALYDAAFGGSRQGKHSDEFKQGALCALLNNEIGAREVVTLRSCPYGPGTTSRDAWDAGFKEGARLWRVNHAAGLI